MKTRPGLKRRPLLRYLPLVAALAVGGALLLSEQVDATPINLAPDRTLVWKDYLGVNAHFLWFTPQQYRKQIAAYKQLGLQWVRVDLHWDRLEPTEEGYQLSTLDELDRTLSDAKLKSLFYLVGSAPFVTTAPKGGPFQDQYPPRDPKVFATRMAMLAQRYPNIDAWQVWNEQNIPNNWRPKPDAKGYGELLLATHQALNQVAPDKIQVMGGMAYYSQMPTQRNALMFEKLGELGVQSLGMVAAYHPYSETPESDEPGKNEVLLRGKQLNDMLHGAGLKRVWATEWGWSSYAGPKEMQRLIGVDGQADYTLRRLALMSDQDYERIFLFALSDLDSRASARDQHYGLLDLNGEPKPVYKALARFLEITGARLKPGKTPVLENLPETFYSVSWTRDDGKRLLMFWSAKGGTIKLPQVHQAELYDPLSGTRASLDAADGIQPAVKSSLQILVW
ncbi:polysaccharide biosynthesis protein PslG [Pseudomonas chlororaphis]|uniref:Cellulase family glycosylhydrolase n=1 Tax=Pseudomonas chlororaphis subsp. aurantiaca TaxID=86192 RepID=A0AAJ1EBB2_9PSED|nr:cellulase family glycosylhydrolase [Pseudomonas chlororaphis]MBU4636516.1 cellulase family glycosylhydrolase [Pseudomonas chlororaphis subsp. aurantiaca]